MSTQSIQISEKIINALETKVERFNSEHNKRIKLSQAKQVFVKSAPDRGDHDLVEYCFARVNLFLRIASGNFELKPLKVSNIGAINIASSIELDKSDFDQAAQDIKDFELDFQVSSIGELYLDYKPLSLVSSFI